MWALVESNNITEVIKSSKPMKIGGVQYPQNIFNVWSKSELEGIGIYEVVQDDTNFKDEEYYYNTKETLSFASNTVTASWGTATAKSLDDSGSGEDLIKGLKTLHKESVNQRAYVLLESSDWMVVRKEEASTAIPSDWSTYRAGVRTAAADMKTKIDAVSDVDALAALYVYNDANPPVRPLGEFPTPPSS
jgi:hypothetical protein